MESGSVKKKNNQSVLRGRHYFGVADLQKITFLDPIRVGETLLPQGNYEVRHVMEGDNHIMPMRYYT